MTRGPMRYWTAQEDTALRRMLADGLPYKEISALLDRSPQAVASYITYYGLPRRYRARPGTVPGRQRRRQQARPKQYDLEDTGEV